MTTATAPASAASAGVGAALLTVILPALYLSAVLHAAAPAFLVYLRPFHPAPAVRQVQVKKVFQVLLHLHLLL